MKELSLRNEIYRKIIHLLSIAIPFCYLIFEKQIALIFVSIIFTICLLTDLLIKPGRPFEEIGKKYLYFIMRDYEIKEKFTLTGATWLSFTSLIVILLFPKDAAILSLFILILGDLFAAIIGKKFGRIKLFKKSIEGTISFILISFLIILIYTLIFDLSSIFVLNCMIASIFAAFMELISKEIYIDDNFSIPMSFCLTIEFLSLIN